MQEDRVDGVGEGALRRSVAALQQVLAIELLTAAARIHLRALLGPSPVTGAVIAAPDDVTRTAPVPTGSSPTTSPGACPAVADGSVVVAAEAVAGHWRETFRIRRCSRRLNTGRH